MAKEEMRMTSTHDLKRRRVKSVYANLVCDATCSYEMVWKICRYRRGSKNRRRQAMRGSLDDAAQAADLNNWRLEARVYMGKVVS